MEHIYLKRSLFIFSFILFFGFSSRAQVNDISFTFAPNAEYTWWDDKAGLEDNYLVGGTLGFGFGKYLEVRALYQQSIDLKRDFSNFGLPSNYETVLNQNNDIDLTRWGGELKANIGTGRLNPFITLGSGVQKIETDFGTETENIYASAGLGIKFNISQRTTLTLEGKNTVFNANNGLALLSDGERDEMGLADSFFESNRLYNWSALASLQFYLGGRSPEELSDLDKAYLNKFKGGFKGFQFVFEPAAAYVDFDNDSFYRDSWFMGGYLGFDFNEYIGLRGFYFQATENEELSSDFDDLAMYGMELRANLNDGNGVIPYIILGGGYLNVYESSYVGQNNTSAESTEFAKGGLGLEIPLGRNVSINGSASGLLTSGQNIEDVSNTDNLQTNIKYSLGLSIQLGKKSENPEDIYEENVNRAVDEKERELTDAYEKKLAAQQKANEEKLNELKSKYTKQIDSLDQALERAYERDDVEEAILILEESQQAKEDLQKVEELQRRNKRQGRGQLPESETKIEEKKAEPSKTEDRQYSMSPLEFEYLITRILDKMEDDDEKTKQEDSDATKSKLEARIKALERQISNDTLVIKTDSIQGKSEMKDKSELEDSETDKILRKLEELESKIEENNRKIQNSSSSRTSRDKSKTTIVNEVTTEGNQPVEEDTDSSESEVREVTDESGITKTIYKREFFNDTTYIDNERESKITPVLIYKGLSAFTGVNFGGQTTWNFGARAHYGFENSNFEILPELSFAPSNPISFGAAINAIHPFKISSQLDIRPYAGLGGGYLYNDEDSVLTGNIIIGAYTNALGGRLYVDYTNRNLFNYNQFALGYRFNF
ncbi:hypothetical protein [Psychroflexus aestuariivivens]|uniref:hypothetical protein n=1 Tax=Psychroflexus aestuariivivens TaxID=1795040 RepID=UPI000FD6C07D|nr:hypothetical protein [Psychroflexus aestuariivivens]